MVAPITNYGRILTHPRRLQPTFTYKKVHSITIYVKEYYKPKK